MKNEQDNSLNPSCGYFIKDRGFVTYVEFSRLGQTPYRVSFILW